MFTTFGVATPTSSSGQKSPPRSQQAQRSKRAQVARACDWCRLTRIKCDPIRPCRSCKQAGRECSTNGRDNFRSVAAARGKLMVMTLKHGVFDRGANWRRRREVQRLRAYVKELEAESRTQTPSRESVSRREIVAPRWQGVSVRGLQYGASSLGYFAHRLSIFTSIDLDLELRLRPPSASLLESESSSHCDLPRPQQDHFLDLFWQIYHAIYPILDEAEFRRHYASLWESPSSRRPCPLVDVMMALCIQFGSTYMSPDNSPMGTTQLLGADFYSRAQQYLERNSEQPNLMSAQCHFLSVVYLVATRQVNSAWSRLGSAVAVAKSLGLQHNAAEKDVSAQGTGLRQAKENLWCCLSMLDTRLSLHLGRPFAVHQSVAQRHRSYDDTSNDESTTYITSSKLGVSWTTFQTARLRLFQLVLDIRSEFFTFCDDVLEEIHEPDFYSNPSARNRCAAFLLQRLKRLKEWTEELPEGLKTARQHGVPFSVDRSALDLSQHDPLWLQRQRLILELEYYDFCILLCRSFITYSPTPALGTLSSDNCCISCVNYAITVTNILHQVLRDTDILTGWYEVIHWQHNAMFALAGFACGYPVCPPTPSSRKALATSAAVFEILAAPELAALAQRLDEKAVDIIRAFTARLGISTPVITPSCFHPDKRSNVAKTGTPVPGSADFEVHEPSGMELNLDMLDASFDFGSVDQEATWGGDVETPLWGEWIKELEREPTSFTGDDAFFKLGGER
ncbi:hypothetical protein G7046_g2734 [Stylonectria norvegica]|nr:hypothetical protein G7046_g2734 [Stylonectria norvegica]